jgi:tRNA (5-methylaminomethyl-2-thiouridylate)-methyltransferase
VILCQYLATRMYRQMNSLPSYGCNSKPLALGPPCYIHGPKNASWTCAFKNDAPRTSQQESKDDSLWYSVLEKAQRIDIDCTMPQQQREEEHRLEMVTMEELLAEHQEGFETSCEVSRQLSVAMLLSGGVDSSLALYLLKKVAKHNVTAFYLQIWFQEDFRNSWDACPWEEDLEYCRKVCESLDVPLKVVPLSEEYWNRVVQHSIGEVKAGRTPNPDMLCNSRVKFGAFYEYLEKRHVDEFDRVASGHYASIRRNENSNGVPLLTLTPDAIKDQTYFLANLRTAQLQKAMFPLGCFDKKTVRLLAQCANLPNKLRKDSQGICFLGKVKFDEFIKEHLGEWPGALVELETDEIVGYHSGYWFYTVGQRRGIRLPGGPWYVVAKDPKYNAVYISKSLADADPDDNKRFDCLNMNWIVDHVEWGRGNILCKVRHGPHMYTCQVTTQRHETINVNQLPSNLHIELDARDQGLADGQYAVLYQDSVCLGCGTISIS